MTGTNSAGHSADLSADLSADHMGMFPFMDQGLNSSVPTSADLGTEQTTHARAQSVVPKGPALAGTAGTGGTDDPADRWRDRKARRAAWEAWEQSDEVLPPPGLVSATLDAAMKREGKPGPRWRR
jgi:hypothetical protein